MKFHEIFVLVFMILAIGFMTVQINHLKIEKQQILEKCMTRRVLK